MSTLLLLVDDFFDGGQRSHEQCISANKDTIYTFTPIKT